MKNLLEAIGSIGLILVCSVTAARADQEFEPPEEPAKIVVQVLDDSYPVGGKVKIRVDLQPMEGVKINRYPKVRMRIGEQDGVVAAKNAEIGDATPPAPEKEASNYFTKFEPLPLEFDLSPTLGPGEHKIAGKMTYFYCMPANGFCAPKKAGFWVPVTIR